MQSEAASTALTKDDPRYAEMFSVEKETQAHGGVLIDDPYSTFAALRALSPIYAGDLTLKMTGESNRQFYRGRPHYATMSFEACSKALLDNITYSSMSYHESPAVLETLGHSILTMVGNEHARYRKAIQPMMSAQQALGWWREKWIEPFVDTLISEIEQQPGETDLTMSLCARLPMHTVTAGYGLSSGEALEFRENLLMSMAPMLPEAQREAAKQKVRDVLMGAIAERRREPRDDLISRLVESPFTDADGKASHLSDEDILSFSRLLLLAGGGTTVRQLGIFLFALLSDPEQLEALRADRALMTAAIEESVRWNTTDPLFHRLTTVDSVLDGVEIPEGAIIDVCLGAGNRDPQRWENPDKYDMHRPEKRHVGFAGGPHTCLGRFVAAAELGSATNALLDRLPKLRLDDRGDAARITGGLLMRGPSHLRVRFD